MGMLKSISLENYKCFRDEVDIEIAPLTILCGINSSGKSSILKSLLMLKQTSESNSTDGSIIFSGDFVDCGTFEDIIYNVGKNSQNSFTLKNKFVVNNHRLVKTGKFVKRQDAKDFNELRRMYFFIEGEIKYFLFETEITVEKYTDNTNEFLQYITNNQIQFYKIKISAFGKDDNLIEDSSGFVSFKINKNKNRVNITRFFIYIFSFIR